MFGERTWRDRAVRRDVNVETNCKTLKRVVGWMARVCLWRVRARHAVFGERTWRDCAICPDVNVEANCKTLKRAVGWMARVCVWRVRARHAVPLLLEKSKGAEANAKERENDRAKYWRYATRFYLGHRPFGSQGKQECLCY